MRVTELLREGTLVEGTWKIQNLDGNYKSFKDDQSPEAKAWMSNRGLNTQKWDGTKWYAVAPPAPKRNWWDDEPKKPAKPKLNLQAVYNKVIDAIGNSFPDGDPIDTIAPWLERQGVDRYKVGETIEKAMKKHGHGEEKKGMYAYLASMWEEHALDVVFDAKNSPESEEPGDTNFYYRDERGRVIMHDNPWLTHDEQKKIRSRYPS